MLDLTYAQYASRKMLADVFLPVGKGPYPGVLIIHGGGWAKGDKMKFRSIGLEMARRGYVSMAMEYRLSGESQFPANIHDCHAAVRYLRSNAKEYKLDPDRIGVVGGSAGGHLAGLLATTSKVKNLHGDGGNEKFSSKVQAVVMSGPMRISTGRVAEKSMQINNAQSFAVKLFGGTIQQLPQQYEAADAHLHIDKDTPPILFQYGGAEDSSEIQPTVEKLEKLEIPVEVLTIIRMVNMVVGKPPLVHADDGRYRRLAPGTPLRIKDRGIFPANLQSVFSSSLMVRALSFRTKGRFFSFCSQVDEFLRVVFHIIKFLGFPG